MLSRTCRFIHRTGCAQLFSRTHCAGGVLNSRLSDNNSCHGATQRHFHTSKALLSKDYYKLLGVTKSSTAKEIKKAYYELAKTHHPDVSKSKDSEKKFQEISEAYEVLGDDSKKKEYDQFGGSNPHNPFGGGGQSQQYQYRQHQGEQMSAEDLFKQAFGGSFDFESMFGNERPSSRPSMGRYEMTISFIEACVGVTRTVTLQFPVQCQNCDGSGGEPGTKQRTCNRCKGAGQTINKVGWYAMQQQCTGCGGTGKVVSQACSGCKGKKTVTINEQAEIKIPAGVDSDTVYKYNTQHGVQIPIRLLVEKSKVFQRNDLDVMSTVNIDMVKAVIGGKVEVESLTGKLEVTVPKNTQPGTTVRLAGKGISGKLTGRGKGHHILKLNVIIPKNISRKQQLLFEVYGGNDSNVEELIKMLGGRLPERLESESEDSSKQSHTQSHTQSTSSSSTSEDSSSKEPESESQSKTDAKSDTKDRPERKNSWTEFKKRYKTEEK